MMMLFLLKLLIQFVVLSSLLNTEQTFTTLLVQGLSTYDFAQIFIHSFDIYNILILLIDILMKLNQYNAATSVYIEQINNFIQVGQGYTQLRRHLLRELNQLSFAESGSDDRLSDSIVGFMSGMLNKTVNFHKSQQTLRMLQIIEDLITYADEAITPAMHNQLFISALVNVARPKIITFDSNTDTQCRTHALQIFLYWYDRFGRDEDSKYELFVKGYKELQSKNLNFPSTITLKPNDTFKKQIEKERNAMNQVLSVHPNANKIVLDDIEDFTIKTQKLFKQNFKSIATTEYVRLIKHRSKTLFEFTSKANDFKEKEKNLVKDLYKRLRVILKELDKYKETSIQTKKNQQIQKQFVQSKITPKKLPPPKDQSPLDTGKSRQMDLLQPKDSKTVEEKKQIKSPISNKNIKSNQEFDLLDLGVETVPLPEKKEEILKMTPKKQVANQPVKTVDLLFDNIQGEQKNEQEQFVQGILVNDKQLSPKKQLFQLFSTPKKEVHDQDKTLLAKQASNKSQQQGHSFDNEKLAKNPYSFIPDNLNLTPTSSVEDEQQKVKEKPGFSFFGLLNFGNAFKGSPQNQVYDQQKRAYDSPHKKGKKFSQQQSNKQTQTEPTAPIPFVIKDVVNSPNYKPVQPINYEQYAVHTYNSPQKEQQQSKFEFSPKKLTHQQLHQIEFTTNKSGQKIKLSQQ